VLDLGADGRHDGDMLRVSKIAPSPLPGDKRPCAYLLRA